MQSSPVKTGLFRQPVAHRITLLLIPLLLVVLAHGADYDAGQPFTQTERGRSNASGSDGDLAVAVTHRIPFFPAASDPLRRLGFARIVNRSDDLAEVSITAFDDSGREHGPVTLTLRAGQTVHFNSEDLEDGNADKGLPEGVGGPSEGSWRLELASDRDINALSYIRTHDGLVAAMHDVAPSEGGTHRVAFFNPASNWRQESLLRLVNPGSAEVAVTIRGIDDRGSAAPGGSVRLSVPPRAARMLSASDLEEGADNLDGKLGDGTGKWRLEVESDRGLTVVSILATPTGHLTNLSTHPGSGSDGDSTAAVTHRIPFFPAASDPLRRLGFARIVNRSDEVAEVSITAFDDSGREHPPVTLTLRAGQTVHFNSEDLEDGNADKGLPEGVGRPSEGSWRLELASDRDINALSYIRTHDGLVAAMHDVAPSEGGTHRVAFFNPASNWRQESLLQLVNPGSAEVAVTIRGIDDRGSAAPGGSVRLSVPPRAARMLSASDLEEGAAHLDGKLGDGTGKWRLDVESDGDLTVVSILATPTGHLTNLSTMPSGSTEPLTPAEGHRIDGMAHAGGSSALPRAECEFATVATDRLGPGTRLAVGTTDGDGKLALLVPGDTDGFLTCRPAGLAKAGLRAFVRGGAAGGASAGHAVSPRSTVAAAVLAAEAARDPSIDLGVRAETLAEDADFTLLVDVAARLFDVLRERGANLDYFRLLLDVFGNGRIDDAGLASNLAAALHRAVAVAEQTVRSRVYAAATRTFIDLPMLAHAHGLDDPAPPPPLPTDPNGLAQRADAFRTAEFANNPALYFMNAHWAYARGGWLRRDHGHGGHWALRSA